MIRTFECWGLLFSGEVLYEYFYERKIADERGRVTHSERRHQRVGLRTETGELIHLTVPEER